MSEATTHDHRVKDIIGYRVVESRWPNSVPEAARTIVEFFDGGFYPNALDVARQISLDPRRAHGIVDRRYRCGCWSVARSPSEMSIEATT